MFGKLGDTTQTVKSLIPKPLTKDPIKLMENQDCVLRYEAVMVKTHSSKTTIIANLYFRTEILNESFLLLIELLIT